MPIEKQWQMKRVDGSEGGIRVDEKGQPYVEFQASRYKGMLFVIKMLAVMFGGLLLTSGALFLLIEALPEFEEQLLTALIILIPLVSLASIWGAGKAHQTRYRIRISSAQVLIERMGRAESLVVELHDAAVMPVNWVASGRYGIRRAGPALEFYHSNHRKTRIALSDPKALWPGDVLEISEPHFVISRQAWDALVAVAN